MAIIKRSQEPQPQEQESVLGSQAFSLLGQFVWLMFANFFRERGYVPYGADRVLADAKRRVWAESRSILQPLYEEDAKKLVTEIARNIDPALLNDKEFIDSLYKTIAQIDQFFPILDTINYPAGSRASLTESILAMLRDMPSGDVRGDAQLAVEMSKRYYDHFYHDADPRNREFMLRTWGAPAGELGSIAYSLYKAGLLKPRLQSIDEQIQILEQFVPAAQAVKYFNRQMGKDIPTIDAVKQVIEINSLLSPEERADPKALLKHVVAVSTYHNKMLQSIMSPRPGALPEKEALQAHVKLLKQASESWAANLFGALVYAKQAGLISPNSPAGVAADEISRGMCPSIFKGKYVTSDLIFNLLLQSGARRDVAEILAYSPFLGRQMVGGLEHPVTLAVRMYQGEEARFLMDQATKQSLAYARSAGLSPQAMALKAKEAQLAVLDMYGYNKESVFRQLHDFDPQATINKHVNEMVDFYTTWAPDPSSIAQRFFNAIRTSKSWDEVFARVSGFMPSAKDHQIPEIPNFENAPQEIGAPGK